MSAVFDIDTEIDLTAAFIAREPRLPSEALDAIVALKEDFLGDVRILVADGQRNQDWTASEAEWANACQDLADEFDALTDALKGCHFGTFSDFCDACIVGLADLDTSEVRA